MPIVGFVTNRSADAIVRQAAAFRKGLSETGYVEGQNVMVEYHWLEGQYDRLPALMADLVRRRVDVIATFANAPALAAKAATTTILIVFGVGQDPVRMGLVASLARSGGNATGINFFNQEAVAKRLGLLHDLVPKAVRIAVLVNPADPSAISPHYERYRKRRAPSDCKLRCSTPVPGARSRRPSAPSCAAGRSSLRRPRRVLHGRPVQFVTLAAHRRIPAAYTQRDFVEAGGLMSYGTDIPEMYRQVGVYTGQILKGAKPADLPVAQSTKFEFVINMQTARALGLEVPNSLQLLADEVID